MSQAPRSFKKRGCFTLTSILALPLEDVELVESMSLVYSWLPLASTAFDQSGPAGFRCPNVIPVLHDSRLRSLRPTLDAYALEHGLAMQPAQYFFNPAKIVEFIGEGALIGESKFSLRNQQLEMPDRLMVDITTQTERKSVMRDLVSLCVQVLETGDFKIPSYIDGKDYSFQISCLLIDFPFLIHHIFDAYPNLQFIRHMGRVNGQEDIVNHVRYDPSAVSDIRTDLFGPEIFKVVV